jgi:hypothetical protein
MVGAKDVIYLKQKYASTFASCLVKQTFELKEISDWRFLGENSQSNSDMSFMGRISS